MRSSVQAEHPGINNIECTRILAEAWKLLPEQERLRFKRHAAEMQSKFKETNPNYSYRRTPQRGGIPPATKTALAMDRPLDDLSCQFRWDMLLNRHDEG
jgi:hypothetical protein